MSSLGSMKGKAVMLIILNTVCSCILAQACSCRFAVRVQYCNLLYNYSFITVHFSFTIPGFAFPESRSQSQSLSSVIADAQSVSISWYQAPSVFEHQIIVTVIHLLVCRSGGNLSDDRTGLYAIAVGSRQRLNSQAPF
jgi:hypothetical protein